MVGPWAPSGLGSCAFGSGAGHDHRRSGRLVELFVSLEVHAHDARLTRADLFFVELACLRPGFAERDEYALNLRPRGVPDAHERLRRFFEAPWRPQNHRGPKNCEPDDDGSVEPEERSQDFA